jgi:hypothetical protein
MHSDVDTLFNHLWQAYVAVTPSAAKIHALLAGEENNNLIVNDHIALRTYDLDKTRLPKLAAHFLKLGYEQKGEYDFAAKKLNAFHFEHSDDTKPKVFISELRVAELSKSSQGIINKCIAQMPDDAASHEDFLYSGRHWQLTINDYNTLLAESEYAAWVAAWGFIANHFTVSINHLSQLNELRQVNELLKGAGFKLNTSGGEIKGGESVYLAQSSTMADKVEVPFSDGTLAIPSCFYEFAQRYKLPDGNLYQGFVAASADKIFESTNVM